MQILYEDNHLLALVKPARLPTMGAAVDRPSLVRLAQRYLKDRYQKPGNVYLGVVSRLDALVSGVVVLARTSKAARRLTEQFRSRLVEKTYWALVEGQMTPRSGMCVDWIGLDDGRPEIVDRREGKEARLEYRTLRLVGRQSLLEIRLETGRKHQIRLQLARRRHPVVGDRRYGSRRDFGPGIALHAQQVAFVHPVRGERLVLRAPLPDSWQRWGISEETPLPPAASKGD